MNRKMPVAAVAAALLSFFAAGQGLAINTMALGDLPIRYMTEEDRALMSEAIDAVLEQGADGQTRNWQNPKTGARGELTPGSAFERDGLRCRDLEVANSAGGRSNRIVLTACRQGDGEWRVQL